MKTVFLLPLFLLIWNFPCLAQNTEKKSQLKPLEFQVPNLNLDTLKIDWNNIKKGAGDTSIEIPNAYNFKKVIPSLQNPEFNINPADDTVILQKKLDGNESSRMPGTEKLEAFGRNIKIDTLKDSKKNVPLKK